MTPLTNYELPQAAPLIGTTQSSSSDPGSSDGYAQLQNNFKFEENFSAQILYTMFFLLKWDFLWNHFVTQNVMINLFLPTHPPKTSGCHFA